MNAGAPPSEAGEPETRQWWESRKVVAALILIAAVPLLYPKLPPLVDLFGHMGRYRVQLDLPTSPYLHQFYSFEWAAIGNLGVDLLLIPLSPIFGLELAVKLIVLAIPPLTVAGFLWVAREVHHRLPPTALFALPFAYSHPFMFGFVNFALSMALALLAFGLWLKLGAAGRLRLRAILFVPISVVVFFTHVFGWGTLGLLCFSGEAVRQHDRGTSWIRSGVGAALHASVMTLPLFIMLAWRSDISGQRTFGWFNWKLKWEWVYSALRDSNQLLDIGAMVVLALVFLFAVFSRKLTFSRNLAFSALVLFGAFLLLPWTIFGSAYADMRIVPYVLAITLLAIRFKGVTQVSLARILAIAGGALYLLRIGLSTFSLALASDDQEAKLQALEFVPYGARLVHLTGDSCRREWAVPRNSHLGAMAIVRRHAFSNDQWAIEGANLLRVKFREAGHFMSDPSQMVRDPRCESPTRWSVNRALAAVRSDVFDYVWLIDPPAYDANLTRDWQLIWRDGGSVLYRTRPAAPEKMQ